MSAAAERERTKRQAWAAPGSRHDTVIAVSRWLLPVLIALLVAALAAWPLTRGGDISFVLAKDRVAIAHERLRVTEALYRGQDGKGQPFSLTAASAVQLSSHDPVVKLSDLSARIGLPDGPAVIVAPRGRYDMDSQRVAIDGPVAVTAADGYRLDTRDVLVDLTTRTAFSRAPVDGTMPLGRFAAGRISVDLASRVLVLDQRARLHIVQGAGKAAR